MARLGDICKINMGQSPDSSSYNDKNDGLPFFQGNADFGELYPTVRVWCSQPSKVANKNDILISVRAPIGALNIADCECCIGRGIAALTVDENACFQKYLWHALHSKVDELNSKGTGSTFKAINKRILEETEIPLPPLDEQRKIAAVLDKISDLTAKRRRQLDKLDELVKSRFVEMFGDPEKNPYGWECTVLANLMSIKPQNGLYKPQTDYVQGNNGVPILRIDAFYNGKVKDFRALKRLMCSKKEIERYELHENDIVINRVNSVEYLGKCAHIRGLVERTVFESNMMRFHLNEAFINPVYAVYLLCTNYVYNQILSKAKKAVNQASINQNDVMSIKLLIPPVAQQKQFANFYITTDRLQSMIKRSFTALEMLKKSLMQEYFSLR